MEEISKKIRYLDKIFINIDKLSDELNIIFHLRSLKYKGNIEYLHIVLKILELIKSLKQSIKLHISYKTLNDFYLNPNNDSYLERFNSNLIINNYCNFNIVNKKLSNDYKVSTNYSQQFLNIKKEINLKIKKIPKNKKIQIKDKIMDFKNIVCINVLNVVSKKIRNEIISNIQELLEDSGVAYLCVPRNVPIKGKYSGFERRPQNYVVLTLNSIYIDKSIEIYELYKNSEYQDSTINIGES